MIWIQIMVKHSFETLLRSFVKPHVRLLGVFSSGEKKIKKLVKIKSICIFVYHTFTVFTRLWSWWLLLDVIWISRENAYKIARTRSEIRYKILGRTFLKGTKIYHLGTKMHPLGVKKKKKVQMCAFWKGSVPVTAFVHFSESEGKTSDKPI